MQQSILIIDDDEDDCEVVKESLFQVGLRISVHACLAGQDAITYLQKIKENLPTLIILDLNMPGMNGREVLQIITSEFGIPVFVYAAGCSEEILLETKKLGAIDCIEKGTSYTDNLKFAKKVKEFVMGLK